MKRKKGLPGFTQTEPELLIGAMERHADWAVVVCLVGGGQEINTGEAGISAWLDGVRTLFPGWDVFISPHLTDSEYAASGALERLKPHAIDIRANIDPAHGFLSPPRDTRSSLYLEDAATEFQVQGLELDWRKSHVGRRLTLEWERPELSQFSRGPKNLKPAGPT
jgi:hypothetical protein